ncbi:MAG: cobyrinate a,c-diamide synthase [Pseudomonadota bacterium]
MMFHAAPRLMISALKGGAGKTILSLGLAAVWREKGYRVAPFKKGPDFIDAGWLTFAAGSPCHNLDPFMMDERQIMRSFLINSAGADISLIEGNRGLFDGLDLEGCCSTAELGRLLKSPVVIVVDVTMTTRTTAALVMGCQKFDPELNTAGVILNRVAGARQESLVRRAVERYCDLPVLGAVPKLEGDFFPERHMGLVPQQERDEAERAVAWARRTVEENLDMEGLWRLARGAGPLDVASPEEEKVFTPTPGGGSLRIGYICDRSFWFYYPENLEHLRKQGAELIEVNAIDDREPPDLDALYIGGGFPETQATHLADNRRFRLALREKIEKGLPVYAECGGLMYLGQALLLKDRSYPMVGILPIKFALEKKPQGHGYTILEVSGENPYFYKGEVLKGHEFHYSRPLFEAGADSIRTVFKVRRGHGLDGKRDGLCMKNLLATYTHLHSVGTPLWGTRFYKTALFLKHSEKKNFE